MNKIKFTVKNEESGAVMGISFDTERRLLTVGGRYKYKDELSETLFSAFKVVVDWHEIGTRIKTEVRLTPTEWREGLERLGEDGFIIERVKGFRRLMN